MSKEKKHFKTDSIHWAEHPRFIEGVPSDVVTPIHLSSTFAREEVDKPGVATYGRVDNPTRKALEARYARLENANYGLAFGSGVAAEAMILLALLRPGDHVVGFDDLYGGTKRLLNKIMAPINVTTSYVDATIPSEVEKAIKPETKLIWLESPTNPLMKVCDIEAITAIARKKGVLTVVDNTFLTPYYQRPLDLGADIVIHSVTKYLGGHSDIIGGAVMLNDEKLYQQIKLYQMAIGAVPSPFDCYLTLRGTKTLAIRMEQHDSNAMQLAKYLEVHPKVAKVFYPGLESHPQYAISKKQATGHGGMISFEIKGGAKEAKAFLKNIKLFILAESLGGVESLIQHPWSMTHGGLSREEKLQTGISESLIRVSAGAEHIDDLIDDISCAFDAM